MKNKFIYIIILLMSFGFLFAKETFQRGFYLTAYKLNMKNSENILKDAADNGYNQVVFDLKNMKGEVFTKVPDSLKVQYDVNGFINISETVKLIHKYKMKATARIVMFHNIYAAENLPELRPYNTKLKEPWQERSHKEPAWLDSSHPQVQSNLLDFIDHIAKQGLDEIQMDYIRFPTQGDHENIRFYFNKFDSTRAAKDSTYVKRDRTDIIAQFIKKAKKTCDKYNTKLTADVFAIAVWQRDIDVKKTGQDLPKMTKYLDAIHPMVYSSHFAKNFGYREDAYNEPYHIVFKCTALAKKFTDKNCKIIPYIQANAYKVNFGKNYMLAQEFAVRNSNSDGYILWDARSRYKKIFKWLGDLSYYGIKNDE